MIFIKVFVSIITTIGYVNTSVNLSVCPNTYYNVNKYVSIYFNEYFYVNVIVNTDIF